MSSRVRWLSEDRPPGGAARHLNEPYRGRRVTGRTLGVRKPSPSGTLRPSTLEPPSLRRGQRWLRGAQEWPTAASRRASHDRRAMRSRRVRSPALRPGIDAALRRSVMLCSCAKNSSVVTRWVSPPWHARDRKGRRDNEGNREQPSSIRSSLCVPPCPRNRVATAIMSLLYPRAVYDPQVTPDWTSSCPMDAIFGDDA